tara:strand:- start:954 stop:1955 length:1002 start_codon:yes stop_codon:yes gene_type:complete
MQRKTMLITGTAILAASLSLIAHAATAQTGGQTYQASAISIENFIGRVEIRTGSSSQISVSISNPGDLVEDPTLQQTGSRLAIDGGQSMRNLNCNIRNEQMSIGRGRFTRHPIADYPVLTITAPESIALHLEESAFQGETGALGALDLSMDNCGRIETGAIAHDVNLSINGSGDVTTAGIGGDVNVDINGSGDVVLGNVSGIADIDINGSGDVRFGDVTGDSTVDINGSGDVAFGTIAGLAVRISGSGDIEAASMNGAFSARINGSGDIAVRDGRAEPFDVYVGGSGDVSFGGTAVNVTVRESGSGDVDIRSVEGSIDWRRNGRQVMRVGETR